MGKFIDNVKAVTGYTAVHNAIMRDVFAQTAAGEYDRPYGLPSFMAAYFVAIGGASLVSSLAGRMVLAADVGGIATHPVLVSATLPMAAVLLAGTAMDRTAKKIKKSIQGAFFDYAVDILKVGEVHSIKEAASLGHAFDYNNRKLSGKTAIRNKNDGSLWWQERLAECQEQNKDILIFAADSGLMRSKTASKLMSHYQAAVLG